MSVQQVPSLSLSHSPVHLSFFSVTLFPSNRQGQSAGWRRTPSFWSMWLRSSPASLKRWARQAWNGTADTPETHLLSWQNTKSVKVPFSTSIILDAYFRFFSSSCNLYICLGLSSLYESAFGWHTRISKKAARCLSQNPRQCTSRRASAAVFAPPLRSSLARGCKVGSLATS